MSHHSLEGLSAPIFFLKATTKKKVWIPQFTKKNGQVVGGHYAMVHVSDDHDHAKVAAGQGTYSQKKAHAKLTKEEGDSFHQLSESDKAALILHHATQIQDEESSAARLATLRKKLLAGEKPTPGEWKVFHAAPDEKRKKILDDVHAAGQGAHMDSLYAQWVAAQPKDQQEAAQGEKQEAKVASQGDKVESSGGKQEPPKPPKSEEMQLQSLFNLSGKAQKLAEDGNVEELQQLHVGLKELLPELIPEAQEYGKNVLGYIGDALEIVRKKLKAASESEKPKNAGGGMSIEVSSNSEKKSAKSDEESAPKAAPTKAAEPNAKSEESTAGAPKKPNIVGSNMAKAAADEIEEAIKKGDIDAIKKLKGDFPAPNKLKWQKMHKYADDAIAFLQEKLNKSPNKSEPSEKKEPNKSHAKEESMPASDQELVDGWEASISAGKVPTAEQAEAMEKLLQSNEDQYLDVHASAQAALALKNGVDPEDDEAISRYAEKVDALHDQAKAQAKPEAGAKGAPIKPTFHGHAGADVMADMVEEGLNNGDAGLLEQTLKIVQDTHNDAHESQKDNWKKVEQYALDSIAFVKNGGKVESGPKDGDTKPAADGGTLEFKDGHWHKKEEPKAAEKPTADHEAIKAKLQAAMLPDSNTNAKPFNAKLTQLMSLAGSGDVKGILGLSYGVNTYGVKAAKLANEVLEALGSSEKVKIGQKAGTHAALTGAAKEEAPPKQEAKINAKKAETPGAQEAEPATPPKKVLGNLFHNTQDGHSKQWAVFLDGNKLITKYGKIGAKQQQTVKEFPNADEAMQAHNAVVIEKLKKKYKLQGEIELDGADAGGAAPAAEQGPKDGDTKMGADGWLEFYDGRWHKVKDAPTSDKVKTPAELKKLAASVPMPKLSGKYAIKMSKTMKELKAIAEKEGSIADYVQLLPSGKLKIKKDGAKLSQGWVPIDLAGAHGPNATAMANYAKALMEKMGDAKGAQSSAAPVSKEEEAAAAEFAAFQAEKAAPPKTVSVVKTTEKVGKISALLADKWKQVGSQKGSNPGGLFEDGNGQKWYCKFPSDEDVVKNELLAAKFYEMLGAKVPSIRLVKKDGKLGLASKWVDGIKKGSAAELANAEGAHSAFVFDAWLANWDVVGLSNDNLMLDKDGKALRVDVGGSLVYRAQGGQKGEDFGNVVTELDTLLDPKKNDKSAAVFQNVSDKDLKAGAEVLAKMRNGQIKKMVDLFGPGDEKAKAELTAKLTARREYILKKLGMEDPWNKPPLDETKLPVNPKDLPEPIDFFKHPDKGGQPLSSKEHINKQNTIDDAALIAFAKQGNLTALKTYEYDAYDKETGAYIGKKPIKEHPSKDIKAHWAEAVELLDSIAHPSVMGLDMPPVGAHGSIAEVAHEAGFLPFGDRVATIPAEKRLGYWMKVAHAGEDFMDLVPKKTFPVAQAVKDAAKAAFSKISGITKAYISAVQATGWINHVFSNGDKTVTASGNGGHYSGDLAGLAAAVYGDAKELEEGTTVGRWMHMSDAMKAQLLQEKPGLIFQNTDSMCTSMDPNWETNGGFGNGAFLEIIYAKGAKGIHSHASGAFKSEQEITTLPGARFMLLEAKKGNKKDKNDGIRLKLLMLPPHEGFIEDIANKAKMGVSA